MDNYSQYLINLGLAYQRKVSQFSNITGVKQIADANTLRTYIGIFYLSSGPAVLGDHDDIVVNKGKDFSTFNPRYEFWIAKDASQTQVSYWVNVGGGSISFEVIEVLYRGNQTYLQDNRSGQ